jgi:undecaprenyl phosphate-alpha-L-ara4FN deformylase
VPSFKQPLMRIALRIVAATVRGAGDGSTRVAELLKRHSAGGTFYFNLGPSRSYRWLPGRAVRNHAHPAMRAVRDAGFEVGVYGWDPARWRSRVGSADYVWTEQAMRRAHAAFEDVFAESPRSHAAPGWRMNRHAMRLTQRLAYDYASDTRGHGPFVPLWDAELIICPQLPTTLPTTEELLRYGGATKRTLHERILDLCVDSPAGGHVFSFSADRPRHAVALLERLIDVWRDLGYDIVSMRTIAESLDPTGLPHRAVATQRMPGRSLSLTTDGVPFLS